MTHYKKAYLEKMIRDYVYKHQKIITFCFGKKRPLYLTKYIEATKNRSDATKRLQLFKKILIDIGTATPEMVNKKSATEYEIQFPLYAAHIREEIVQKDKILFLISTFEK